AEIAPKKAQEFCPWKSCCVQRRPLHPALHQKSVAEAHYRSTETLLRQSAGIVVFSFSGSTNPCEFYEPAIFPALRNELAPCKTAIQDDEGCLAQGFVQRPHSFFHPVS